MQYVQMALYTTLLNCVQAINTTTSALPSPRYSLSLAAVDFPKTTRDKPFRNHNTPPSPS